MAKGGGCRTQTSRLRRSQQTNVSSLESSLRQLKCLTSMHHHWNLAPASRNFLRQALAVSSMQSKMASSSMKRTVSRAGSISPAWISFKVRSARHRLSFPPENDI